MAGDAIHRSGGGWLPSFSTKTLPWMNRIGNAVLTIGIAALLWVMREALKGLLMWALPVGAVLLALGSVACKGGTPSLRMTNQFSHSLRCAAVG